MLKNKNDKLRNKMLKYTKCKNDQSKKCKLLLLSEKLQVQQMLILLQVTALALIIAKIAVKQKSRKYTT